MTTYVTYETRDRRAYLTLNRPDKRNALNGEVVAQLQAAFERAAADEAAKVVVLAANGPAFCAGADLEYLTQLQRNTYEENVADSRQLARLFETIYTLPKVVIARVQGHAIAGGCGLATVCDFAFAVPEAKFGYTEVKIGFVPAIVSYFLSRKIGDGKARELLLTGQLISAEQAQEYGLISRVVEAETLDKEIEALAETLVRQNAGQSLAWTKRLLAELPQMPIAEAMQHAAEANAQARATDDCRRGIAAFLEKREIEW
jgi:methylglutaconyl-CoA hydratase